MADAPLELKSIQNTTLLVSNVSKLNYKVC